MWNKLFIVFVIVFVLSFFWLMFFPNTVSKTAQITLGGEELTVFLAQTPEERTRGLSGREGLDPGTGMLFVFPAPDRYAFVMRNMQFPLDIIWLNEGKVVDIAANLAPDPAGEAELIRYLPRAPATLVLEVPAGWAAAHKVGIGSEIALVEEGS